MACKKDPVHAAANFHGFFISQPLPPVRRLQQLSVCFLAWLDNDIHVCRFWVVVLAWKYSSGLGANARTCHADVMKSYLELTRYTLSWDVLTQLRFDVISLPGYWKKTKGIKWSTIYLSVCSSIKQLCDLISAKLKKVFLPIWFFSSILICGTVS